ncbi:pentatricopeptide repeat-containing protein At4g18840-like [Macadamia integrifolia]|uniref:pentatricopeptide repeat-containing protein At4g18840-like n=1 Tax=Macadamia integrifolia TaxID=60698 RepID=UPI001C500664|nr:pentatricopeptide repeat-containing protein At4g18840-like [Macadamia integrifolia]
MSATFSSHLYPFKPAKRDSRVDSVSVRLQPWLAFLELCRNTDEFAQIHSKFIKLGLIHHPLAFTRLMAFCSISPYADMGYARSIFNRDAKPNSFAYNVMIRGYAQSNQPEEALSLFYEMVCDGNSTPNALTFPFVLKACSKLNAIEEGREVHGQLFKYGLGGDLFVQNGLITLYSCCGSVDLSVQVFEKIPRPDIVSWNSIITGMVDSGFIEEAHSMFDRMPNRNAVSWNCLIDGYVKSVCLEKARWLFDQMEGKNSITWNIMIGGYVTGGLMKDARKLFVQMPLRLKDLVTLKLMIDGYAREGSFAEVLEIFQEMQTLKIKPDKFTIVNALSACSHLAALEQGEWIHGFVDKNNFKLEAVLGTALVNLYAKCGKIETALSVFYRIEDKDVEAWNSIIYSLGVHGFGKEALEFFSSMLDSQMPPDEATFLSVLSSCRHSGFVEEGRRFFNLMSQVYNVKPRLDHYGCMVDLLGRAGLLDEAKELIEKMEIKSSVPMWGALLGACSRLGNVEMGEYAAKHLMEMDPNDPSSYVVLSNMYAAAGMNEDAIEVRKRMRNLGIEKVPGCSLIEVNGIVHEFLVSSDSLEETSLVYATGL